jgi:nitrite reductase (NADH) large subunit
MGSSPNRPRIDGAENAIAFRSYDDTVKIREAALAEGRAAIIGGGLLGLDTAWELNAAGVKVSLIECSDWLLPRQLNREAGLYLRRRLESSGIGFVTGQDPSTLAEIYRVACIVMTAGVHADLKALIPGSVAVNRGIIVDGRMSTSMEGVYACGDAAEFMGQSLGLLAAAQEQGKVAGINAAGGDAVYMEMPPSPVLKVGSVSIFSVGDLSAGNGAASFSGETGNSYAYLTLRDGVLTGAMLVGDATVGMKLKKAVMEKRKFADSHTINEILAAV